MLLLGLLDAVEVERVGGVNNSLGACILDAIVILKGGTSVKYGNEFDGAWEMPVYGNVRASNTEGAYTWGLR
jgi:hypothetical protein